MQRASITTLPLHPTAHTYLLRTINKQLRTKTISLARRPEHPQPQQQQHQEQQQRQQSYFAYILVSESTGRTYNGITTCPQRRLRQHLGLAPGGAKATRVARDWRYLALLHHPCWDPSSATAFEHALRHPTGSKTRLARFAGPAGRVAALELLLSEPARRGDPALWVWLHPAHLDAAPAGGSVRRRLDDSRRAACLGGGGPEGVKQVLEQLLPFLDSQAGLGAGAARLP